MRLRECVVESRRPQVRTLSIDFETRSTVDLRETGVYPYAVHESTGIWCFAWAFDDDEPQLWHPGMDFPQEIADHIAAGGECRAWNAAFERIMWRDCGVPKYGFPPVQDDQWVCTAAEAAAMALPRSLDQCAQVTGVAAQKDQDGYGLMLRMARPRKVLDDGTPVWWDVEDRKQRLYEYCKQDVRTERALVRVLRRLTPNERELYKLDQRINDRGVKLDRKLVLAAKDIVNEGVERANLVLSELTNGQVTAVTQTGNLKQWLGVESVAKAAVKNMLESDLAPDVRSVLETRAEAGRSSVAKLDSMLTVAMADDRLRGLLLYHAASTGRWAGRLVQPQNFPKGDIENIESYIEDVMAGRYDMIDLMASPIAVVSSMLRSMLTAEEGHELVAGDLSAIEAVSLNYLAGQWDVVENFRAYFAGDKDRDPYRVNAAHFYKIPLSEVLKFPHRHTGKFIELGFGFGMGEKKAVSAGKAIYGIDITEEEAKMAKMVYRETHPEVQQLWGDANNAAIMAVENPGSVQIIGAQQNIKFTKQGAYLYLVLPSKRPLVYASPKIVEQETPWGSVQPAVEISSVDSFTKQWGRSRLYGGLIVENIVQAFARDLIAEAMFRLEDAAYPVVLSVHDENVSEIPVGFGSVEEYTEIMQIAPEWAQGLPIKSEVWRGKRYRK